MEAAVQEGLAAAFDVPVAAVRRAAMLMSSTTAAAAVLLTGGLEAVQAVGLQVGVAIQPMLAASAPGSDAALDKTGLPAVVDYKLDGVRVQVHRADEEVRIFTRSLDDITARLPEVVAVARALPHDQLVLDGEVLSLRSDGRPEAFQVVASRTMSSVEVAALAQTGPLQVFFFDLLHVDGRDLLDAPLSERLELMRQVLPETVTVPREFCMSSAEAADTFADAVRRGYEGVVIKNLSAPYAAGRRDSAWVKVKPRHTFDLIVTAAEWGHGRRQGWLSNLHLAARDPASGELVMLGKTFKGLTDELLTWQTTRFLELEVRRTAGTVYVDPSTVVEIACDGLQVSTRYPGGVALRFARVLRYRPDKSAAEADTIDIVKALARSLTAPEITQAWTNPRAWQRALCGRPFLAGLVEARSMLAGWTNPALAGSGVGCGLARPHATSRTQSGAASWPSPHMSKSHSFFGPPPFRVSLKYARSGAGSTDFADCGRGQRQIHAMKHR